MAQTQAWQLLLSADTVDCVVEAPYGAALLCDTANYIIMATIAAPTLSMLGVEPIVAHFFVLYYDVLADITPPVALAAYAAAGMVGADPFKTGNTAFRLGLGKVLVPFVFVFSPSLLLVTANFSWDNFVIAFVGCVLGITCLGSALSGFMLVKTAAWERILLIVAAILLVVRELVSSHHWSALR